MATAESQPSSSGRTTPETDAAERMAFAGEYMVPTDFARRLERERDEARAWVGEIFRLLGLPEGDMGALENFIRQRDEWARLCGQYKQERDEARNQAEYYRERYQQLKNEREAAE
jgi:hypothetical protein